LTTLPRRSPRVSPLGETPTKIADSINLLEEQPRIPFKTPASQTADGFHGEVCHDETYLYLYSDTFKWARFLKAW
jgi:hypothetical protein